MTIEERSRQIKEKWKLSSIHFFFDDSYPGIYRAFVFRRNAKGFQASVTEGLGKSFLAALDDAEQNLIAGPVNAADRIADAKKKFAA
ncbi:MAG TPA: hypothetical protein VG892_07695 [Terriglobales bacterium]|nr:hypothetical protein [Terriglobales bacterium]